MWIKQAVRISEGQIIWATLYSILSCCRGIRCPKGRGICCPISIEIGTDEDFIQHVQVLKFLKYYKIKMASLFTFYHPVTLVLNSCDHWYPTGTWVNSRGKKVNSNSKVAVYTCKPLIYTCKPLFYKKNLKERCYPPQCPAKLWQEQL